MLKHLFAAATLFLSLSTMAATEPVQIQVGGELKTQQDQYYRYDFGQTSVNMPVYRDFYLSNAGPGNLIVHQIAISGADFYASHYCPSVLPPQTRCTISVRFMPWMEGYSTGRMYIDTSSGLITMDFTGWGYRY